MSESADILPVIPSLALVTKNFITAVYKRPQDEIPQILDNFLFKNADLTYNGRKLSHQHFLNEFQTQKFLEQDADVKFLNVVEVERGAKEEAGSVGVFFTVIIFEKVRVRNEAVIHEITASFNVEIETEFDIVEPGEPKPPPLIPRDRRKAKKVNVVILDKREPLRPFGK